MRKMFPGYYRPTEEEFVSLWNDCLFVLDANILLNLYRHNIEASNDWLKILKGISKRLWVPHQAALEYQRNRLKVIDEQSNAYKTILDDLENNKKKLFEQLNKHKKHPLIKVDQWHRPINRLFSRIKKQLEAQKIKHPDLFKHDSLREEVTLLLEGKVGPSYSQERLKEIYKEGQERYAESIPPGYKDVTKNGNAKYGDLVLWFQIIEMAKEVKKPIILVTDENKDDWWEEITGKTIGPRPELMQEFFSKVGKIFYMYNSESFMIYAGGYLEQEVDQKTVDEIRELRTRDDQSLLMTRGVKLFEELEKVHHQEKHLESDIARLERESMLTMENILTIGNELANMEIAGKGKQPHLKKLALENNLMRLTNKHLKLQETILEFKRTYENVQQIRENIDRSLKNYLISPD